MSVAHLINVCQVCGAEESLDALLARMIDDPETRGLIADVIATSLPLGMDVLRYLRLHKPPKQRLRLATVRKLLAELVVDIQRTSIERHGRIWAVSSESWRLALEAVFENAERGAIKLPLEGNGYLYAVLTRMADRAEAAQEIANENALRSRPCQPGGMAVGYAIAAERLPSLEPESAPSADLEAAARAQAIKDQLRTVLAEKKAKQSAPGQQVNEETKAHQ